MNQDPYITNLGRQLKDMLKGSETKAAEDMVKVYRDLRLLKEHAEEIVKTVTKSVDQLRRETLPTLFKERGISSITVEGYRYTISENVYASIPPEGKVDAYAWLRSNDLAALIIETVNASTLSAQARALMEEGKELPPELFKVSILPNVSMTKAGD